MALLTVENCMARVPQAATASLGIMEDVIAEAQGLADGACGRVLESANYTEYHDIGSGQTLVALRQSPVTGTPAVYTDANTTIPTTLTDCTSYTLDTDAGILASTGAFPSGPRNLLVTYTAGYTAATCPAGLRRVLYQIVGWILESAGNSGAASEGQDGYNVTYEELRDGLPLSLWAALQPWRKVVVG